MNPFIGKMSLVEVILIIILVIVIILYICSFYQIFGRNGCYNRIALDRFFDRWHQYFEANNICEENTGKTDGDKSRRDACEIEISGRGHLV